MYIEKLHEKRCETCSHFRICGIKHIEVIMDPDYPIDYLCEHYEPHLEEPSLWWKNLYVHYLDECQDRGVKPIRELWKEINTFKQDFNVSDDFRRIIHGMALQLLCDTCEDEIKKEKLRFCVGEE